MKPSAFSFVCFVALIAAAISAGNSHPGTKESSAAWTQAVRIDPAHPNHFARQDSSHFFLFNKTAWQYFSCAYPEITLDRASHIGASVIRVHLEGNTYYADLGFDAWPWGGTREKPDYSSFNEAYWDRVDQRIELAAKRGIGLNLTLFKSLKLPDDPASIELMRPYLERVIRRLSRHPNIFCWEVHNEYVANPRFQAAVGQFLKANDPRHRPVISSDGTTDSPLWPHADWMDLALVHTCTGNQPAYDLRDWYLAIARNLRVFGKPVFNNETGREIRHKNDDPVHRRKQLWIAAAAGGYTTWHSWDGCEGIDDPNYHAPGESFVRPFVDWWTNQDYWRVDPVESTVQLSSSDPLREELIPVALASPERDLVLTYLFTRNAGIGVAEAQVRLRVPNGTYQVDYYDPANGEPVATTLQFESKGLWRQNLVTLPPFTDDLALRIRLVKSSQRTLIEGTR